MRDKAFDLIANFNMHLLLLLEFVIGQKNKASYVCHLVLCRIIDCPYLPKF